MMLMVEGSGYIISTTLLPHIAPRLIWVGAATVSEPEPFTVLAGCLMLLQTEGSLAPFGGAAAVAVPHTDNNQ